MKLRYVVIALALVLLISGCNIPRTLKDPSFSPNPDDGPFQGEVTVILTSPNSGADIYYTLGVSDPDEDAIKYTGPITLTETTLVKAVVFKEDHFLSSGIVTAAYIIE
jgi:hypothetical protein